MVREREKHEKSGLIKILLMIQLHIVWNEWMPQQRSLSSDSEPFGVISRNVLNTNEQLQLELTAGTHLRRLKTTAWISELELKSLGTFVASCVLWNHNFGKIRASERVRDSSTFLGYNFVAKSYISKFHELFTSFNHCSLWWPNWNPNSSFICINNDTRNDQNDRANKCVEHKQCNFTVTVKSLLRIKSSFSFRALQLIILIIILSYDKLKICL